MGRPRWPGAWVLAGRFGGGLQDRLARWAGAGHDGRYARLFGSMSAAISQQLAAVHA